MVTVVLVVVVAIVWCRMLHVSLLRSYMQCMHPLGVLTSSFCVVSLVTFVHIVTVGLVQGLLTDDG